MEYRNEQQQQNEWKKNTYDYPTLALSTNSLGIRSPFSVYNAK